MIKPVFTEKSTRMAREGGYTFLVDREMNKRTIASEIAKLFGVTVLGVRTVKVSGEKGKNGRGKKFTKNSGKKAIIMLKEGEKIDLFEEGKK
jgi:large subunit ribosomal protein L23